MSGRQVERRRDVDGGHADFTAGPAGSHDFDLFDDLFLDDDGFFDFDDLLGLDDDFLLDFDDFDDFLLDLDDDFSFDDYCLYDGLAFDDDFLLDDDGFDDAFAFNDDFLLDDDGLRYCDLDALFNDNRLNDGFGATGKPMPRW